MPLAVELQRPISSSVFPPPPEAAVMLSTPVPLRLNVLLKAPVFMPNMIPREVL